MKKNLLLCFVSALTILAGFQNCARGTDTGNPMTDAASSMFSPPDDGPLLQLEICGALKVCHPAMPMSSCVHTVYALPGLAKQFGAQSTSQSLKQLASVGPQSTKLLGCVAELASLQCANPDVQNAYDPARPDPYAGVITMIPQTADCPGVFLGY